MILLLTSKQGLKIKNIELKEMTETQKRVQETLAILDEARARFESATSRDAGRCLLPFLCCTHVECFGIDLCMHILISIDFLATEALDEWRRQLAARSASLAPFERQNAQLAVDRASAAHRQRWVPNAMLHLSFILRIIYDTNI